MQPTASRSTGTTTYPLTLPAGLRRLADGRHLFLNNGNGKVYALRVEELAD
jgi:hypothetical protein